MNHSSSAKRVHFHSRLNLPTFAKCATWRKEFLLSAAVSFRGSISPARKTLLCINADAYENK